MLFLKLRRLSGPWRTGWVMAWADLEAYTRGADLHFGKQGWAC